MTLEFIPYTKEDIKNGRFIRVPKEFIEVDIYRAKLNANAKLLYALLRDRYELSISNNWIDKNTGYVYCYYSRENLAHDLGISVRTVDKALDLLKELCLLNESHHNGKAKKYYIGVPITPVNSARVEGEPLQKLHPNETESFYKETENNKGAERDSARVAFSFQEFKEQFSIDDIGVVECVEYYLTLYQQYRREGHPNLKAEQWQYVVENMFYVVDDRTGVDFDLTENDVIDMMEQHFKTKYKKCDYNILHFMTDGVRANRMYEVAF